MERPPKGTNGASPSDADVAQALERLGVPLEQLKKVVRTLDPQPTNPVERVTGHLRRYLPLYALGTVWAMMLVLVPTVTRDGGSQNASTLARGTADGTDQTDGAGDIVSTDEPGAVVPGSGPAAAGSVASRGAKGAAGKTAIAPVLAGAGVTRGGFECKPGVRQIPWSAYAAPCVGKFEGFNGGVTARGVTDKEIKIVVRQNADAGGPNAQTVDEVSKQAGRATRSEALQILQKYTDYFNKTYELYGRKIVYEMYGSTVSNGTEEAQSKNKEGACADANAIANEKKAFGDIRYDPNFVETQPWAECAAEYKIFTPFGASYFPEQYYQRWDPYVWHLAMQCEQITADFAEYIGKRLANKPAKWAGDPTYQRQNRVFGTYVPDNPGYQRCVEMGEKKLQDEYGVKIKHRFNYILDVSRFPDQAAQAVIQFQSAGVTTLINACDPISTIFLTQAASGQGWKPEWYIIGVALQDTAGNARLYSQDEVNGHLFGMSQLGSDEKIFGKDGEAYKTWKTAYPTEEPPRGFGTIYGWAVGLFNYIQAAGPNLSSASIAAGVRKMAAVGGSSGPFGTWSYTTDHTAIDDSREVYWVGDATAFDGAKGAYIESYGGKRFGTGQWPAEEPPIYKK